LTSPTSTSGFSKVCVRQEELRRLMREKKRQNADKKRIESPFAKYPRLGHLSCTLCSAPVKSELLWQTHVLGKQHRERVAELKGAKQAASGSAAGASSQPVKRKTADAESTQLKKTKGKEGKYFFKRLQESGSFTCSVLGFLLLCCEPMTVELMSACCCWKGKKKENTAEALPEGFFDDPEVDAKVRKVDAPKDQMDKEWDEFQKAMRQVNTISEAIVAEDDEEGRLDRQIGEIDEQIECYRRVELLRNRQDLMKEKCKEAMRLRATQEKEDEAIGSEDEEELQDLLSQDWRVKGALL
uniref:Zinc finger protein 830 n=1 Tax=Meleagris gallopavo TaxID=9103 RepID=A0A803XY85_MELGA